MAPTNVLVAIGSGGIGMACVRRLAPGHTVLLADVSDEALAREHKSLELDGFIVETTMVDIVDHASVQALATQAAKLGHLSIIIHTAGLSPAMASVEKIYEVDLLGTANVIDAFLPVAVPGMAMVCVASMAAHFCQDMMSRELKQHLTHASLETLLQHDDLKKIDHPGIAYGISKRGNQFRVTAAARSYGEKGARINTISPGVIQTPMQQKEMEGDSGARMRGFVEQSATQRFGTPYDITNAAAFLCSPDASFVTGTDLLVDGGAYGAASTTKPE